MKHQVEGKIHNFMNRKMEEFPDLQQPVNKIIEEWR